MLSQLHGNMTEDSVNGHCFESSIGRTLCSISHLYIATPAQALGDFILQKKQPAKKWWQSHHKYLFFLFNLHFSNL